MGRVRYIKTVNEGLQDDFVEIQLHHDTTWKLKPGEGLGLVQAHAAVFFGRIGVTRRLLGLSLWDSGVC